MFTFTRVSLFLSLLQMKVEQDRHYENLVRKAHEEAFKAEARAYEERVRAQQEAISARLRLK